MSLVPEDVLRRIVATYDPQHVILFGSRARGDARPDSDIDLMVVLDDDAPPERLRFRNIGEDVDLLRCRASWLRDRAHIRGAFAATILREGRTVYERDGAEPLTASHSAEHTPPTEAGTWMQRADDDLRVARLASEPTPPMPPAAAFHVQQAAEKLVKALLILADREVPKSHDIGKLIERLGPVPGLDAELAATLAEYTDWAFAGLYPDQDPEPTAEQVAAALPPVDRLRALVADRLAGA